MVMKLLRAVGAAVTAFVDELSPYDFPLFADIPEEQPLLRWGQDSSCDELAAGAFEDQVPAGVDSPTAPAGLPEPELIAAASIGLREWADGTQCDLPLYWAWIARELAPK
jgi:hypothetical protein